MLMPSFKGIRELLSENLGNMLSVNLYQNPFTCSEHIEWGIKFATKIIVNVFFNNKQNLPTDSVKVSKSEKWKSD